MPSRGKLFSTKDLYSYVFIWIDVEIINRINFKKNIRFTFKTRFPGDKLAPSLFIYCRIFECRGNSVSSSNWNCKQYALVICFSLIHFEFWLMNAIKIASSSSTEPDMFRWRVEYSLASWILRSSPDVNAKFISNFKCFVVILRGTLQLYVKVSTLCSHVNEL